MYYSGYFGGVNLDSGGADTVAGLVDGYFPTVGRVNGHVDVMESVEPFWKGVVQLQKNFLGVSGVCGHVADACAEHNLAVVENLRNLDYREVEVTVCAVAKFLCEFGEMQVKIVGIVRVDTLAQVWGILIGSTTANCICSCKRAVGVIVRGSAGKDVDFVGSACLVFLYRFFGYGFGYHLGRARGCESGESEVCVVGNLGGCFLCRENWKCHISVIV